MNQKWFMEDIAMNKKKMSILALIVATVILLLCFCNKDNTLHADPGDMAEGALTCIYGWRDIDMLMSLTPYEEGTEIYDIASRYFLEMMDNPGWVSSYKEIDSGDLKKTDKRAYEEMKYELERYGVTGVKAMKRYTYQCDGFDDIAIYVAKIGRNWFTVMAE